MPGRLSVQVLVQDKESATPLVDCTVLLFNREATPLPVEVTSVQLNGKGVLPRPARWELKGLETKHLTIPNLAIPDYETDLDCELAMIVDGQTVRHATVLQCLTEREADELFEGWAKRDRNGN